MRCWQIILTVWAASSIVGAAVLGQILRNLNRPGPGEGDR